VAVSILDRRAQRRTIAKRLNKLCVRNDIESLRELVDMIDQIPPIPGERNRKRLCDEIRRRTAHLRVLRPPLSVAATGDVLLQQKEMWQQLLREHEAEIIRGEDGTAGRETSG
jgi:hypothetical protein